MVQEGCQPGALAAFLENDLDPFVPKRHLGQNFLWEI